ncbi:MAG: hypothetical protein COA38_07450 [Fluviicola sp.]|nr:MAG: hypothetical protein COA38_07450 [Fluviicola sp.]
MKFIIIPYIALGLVLSVAIGIEYNFIGEEMMPTYWGSPFVYKQESLGSSLERYYSISGLVLNILVWSIVLFFIDKGIRRIKLIKKNEITYKAIIALFIVFTSLNVVSDYSLIGNGFKENLNYWYWDIDEKAENWGGKYEGEMTTLNK